MNKYALSDFRYATSGKLLDSQYDNFFKAIITAAWNVKSDGDVEALTGFFALIEMPDNKAELEQMIDAVGSYQNSQGWDATPGLMWPDAGWYVSTENSDGFIYVYEFPTKSSAENDYDKLEQEFAEWGSDSDEASEHRYNSAPYCAKCGGPREMPSDKKGEY